MTGPAGPIGVSGFEYRTAARTIPADSGLRWEVNCPTGKKALGGGVATNGFPFAVHVHETAPAGDATGWGVAVTNLANTSVSEFAWLICAAVS